MIGFIRDTPVVFALLIALVTATLAWLYEKTLEKDAAKVNKTFNKTLVAGVLAALVLTWLTQRPEPVSSEPFFPE